MLVKSLGLIYTGIRRFCDKAKFPFMYLHKFLFLSLSVCESYILKSYGFLVIHKYKLHVEGDFINSSFGTIWTAINNVAKTVQCISYKRPSVGYQNT